MVLPSDEVADLLVLWTLHTHAIESAFATPYLRIVSAAPNSGKTLLLEILAKLTCRGWHAIMPSLAVMYRKVDAYSPTLLLDEMDGYNLDERTDALGVLNSGYKRGATVDRCKESGELEEFKTFCAKAFAGLDTKAMAPSLLSRTVTIRLERKLPSEGTEMWIEQLTAPAAQELRERCAAWAFHNVGALNDARPELPTLAAQPRRGGLVGAAGRCRSDRRRVAGASSGGVEGARHRRRLDRREAGDRDAARGHRCGLRGVDRNLHRGAAGQAQRDRGAPLGRPAPRRGDRRSRAGQKLRALRVKPKHGAHRLGDG